MPKPFFKQLLVKLKEIGRNLYKIAHTFYKKYGKRAIVLQVAKYALFLFLGFCILILLLFFYYTYDLPRPEKFTETPFIQSTKIYDRTGKVLLYDIYGEEKREIVSFDKISDNLKHSVLASEDARFYNHSGIDVRSIIRSVVTNITDPKNAFKGTSTITQQLIRSVYLTNQKTLSRKIKEIVLSIELERRYSKDQIFDWYLNQIPFGRNAYGAEAAAQTYFSKPASDLSIAQAALLTALIPAPSYYSPYGSHKDLLLQKKDYILDREKQLGYITDAQLKEAKAEVLEFSTINTQIKAPHFVMYVQQYLENKYGDEYLKQKGLKVYTTLDWELQEYAQKVVKEADVTNKKFKAHNAALVVIDPKTGEILTLLGSKDYFTKSYPEGCDKKASGKCLFDPQYDVATLGQRQPGSSFKPFVYATAFKKGYTPKTILWDVKTEFNTNCDPNGNQNQKSCYHPVNYDGLYRGPISIRLSLAQSLNVPAVEALYLAGIDESIQTAHDMGINSLNDSKSYGLSLVLGGGEVNLLEMTSAYGVFATEGERIPPVSILKIEDNQGNIIDENKKQPTKVLDTQVARQINSVLSDNNARAPIFGVNNALYFNNYQVAAKTGTTQYLNDGWTMGYTPFASVGVWVGNNDNSSTTSQGMGLAAPIWRKVMQKLLETHPKEDFIEPAEIQSPNPILLGQIPPEDSLHNILYYIDKNDPKNPSYPNPNKDPQYLHWEIAVQNYLSSINPQPTPEPQPEIPIPPTP